MSSENDVSQNFFGDDYTLGIVEYGVKYFVSPEFAQERM